MITTWAEQVDDGMISFNEVKEDCRLSCLIVNKRRRQCFLVAGVMRKLNPTKEDIEYFFETSAEILRVLDEWKIPLGEPCSKLLLL